MREALAAAIAGGAALVFARDASAVAEIRAAAPQADMILLVIDGAVPNLDAAMLIAALGPLAVEVAPATRIVALQVATGADEDDVVVAAQFLTGAASTTGQVLRIGPRYDAPPRSHRPSERTTSA